MDDGSGGLFIHLRVGLHSAHDAWSLPDASLPSYVDLEHCSEQVWKEDVFGTCNISSDDKSKLR